MEQQKSMVFITILLALTAGYCDTVTFVSAGELFSAHVTGNFIVFAYDLIKHADTVSWLKLLSFPVFIIAVIIGGIIASRSITASNILMLEGVILTLTGITYLALLPAELILHHWINFSLAMCIVFAMGLQNAFGKIYPKETYGPTTMMTGNVTQAALDLGKMFNSKVEDFSTKASFYHDSITIVSFLAGCVFGGILGKGIGLTAVSIPGAVMIIYATGIRKPEPELR
jgi:uncharacterized membrane protein YoaK (UPF0700 family)